MYLSVWLSDWLSVCLSDYSLSVFVCWSIGSLSHLTKKFEFLNGRIGKLGAAIGMKGNAFFFSISFVVLLVFKLVVLIKSLGKRLKIGL